MKFKEWLLGSHQKSFDLPEQEKNSTEAWLPVADIRNGVILLKDGRIAKILEVLPVLFDLKSEMEKENLVYYFASYLKIAPAHLQIRIVNHPALRRLPMLLETPNELPGYAAEIALLRGFEEAE